MKIVLTNDDGIEEPGLAALARLCQKLGEVIVVAPARSQSGISHRLTEDREIRVEERAPGWTAVHGTPADCARLALREIVQGADWLVSGINAGANLGMDVHVSGTVAAAREAAVLGCPALALSQYRRRFSPIDWSRCEQRAAQVLQLAFERGAPAGSFWNANLPHPVDEAVDCEIVECELDANPGAMRYERRGDAFAWLGDYHSRPRSSGRDVDVCFSGRVALSLLRTVPQWQPLSTAT